MRQNLKPNLKSNDPISPETTEALGQNQPAPRKRANQVPAPQVYETLLPSANNGKTLVETNVPRSIAPTPNVRRPAIAPKLKPNLKSNDPISPETTEALGQNQPAPRKRANQVPAPQVYETLLPSANNGKTLVETNVPRSIAPTPNVRRPAIAPKLKPNLKSNDPISPETTEALGQNQPAPRKRANQVPAPQVYETLLPSANNGKTLVETNVPRSIAPTPNVRRPAIAPKLKPNLKSNDPISPETTEALGQNQPAPRKRADQIPAPQVYETLPPLPTTLLQKEDSKSVSADDYVKLRGLLALPSDAPIQKEGPLDQNVHYARVDKNKKLSGEPETENRKDDSVKQSGVPSVNNVDKSTFYDGSSSGDQKKSKNDNKNNKGGLFSKFFKNNKNKESKVDESVDLGVGSPLRKSLPPSRVKKKNSSQETTDALGVGSPLRKFFASFSCEEKEFSTGE